MSPQNVALRMTKHPITCTIEDDEGRERCEFCNFEVEFIEPAKPTLLPYYRHKVGSRLMSDERGPLADSASMSLLQREVIRLTEERDALQRANEIVAGAFNDEVSVREISLKMLGSTVEGHAVFADDTHAALKILAAAALSFLEIDGVVPPNYRTGSVHGTLKNGEGEYFLEFATCRSSSQTPHNLRMKAEAERDAALAELAALKGDS